MTLTTTQKTGGWNRGWLDLSLVAIVFAVIGLWYAGSDFVAGFGTALPSFPAGGGTAFMSAGDHFEQFYRHTLPYHNGMRGLPLYYSGYEYALGQASPFYEGWIFLPFSLLTSALAIFIGPIAAYNLVAVLSFSLCGMFGYLLGREVGNGHRLAGYGAAALIALLPFRVSFLFGEMVYATDMALLPLALFAFVRFVNVQTWRWSGLFFLSAFLLSAANFALFYWFILFFGPMFVIGAVLVARTYGRDLKKWGLLMASAIPFLLLMAWNLGTVTSILSASDLSSGQGIDEVRFYSPSLKHLFTRWAGNEKSIYLGLCGILAMLGMLIVVLQKGWKSGWKESSGTRLIALYALCIFPISYLFALGLTFDDATGIGFYTFFFEHIPGVSSSRTPGRIMPVVAVAAAVLVAISCAWMSKRIVNTQARIAVAVLLVYLIAWDFRFSNVRMSTMVSGNQAYRSTVSLGNGNIVAIPFQREGDHYMNATYQFFAITNGARLANGHSSMYPKQWDAFAGRFYETLNAGVVPRKDLQELKRMGIGYIAVHNTSYAPSVSPMVAAILERNPALRKVATDQGVVMFEIGDPALAPESISTQDVVSALQSDSAGLKNMQGPEEISYFMGWYAREAYPGQPAFRWMAGIQSAIVLPPPPTETGDDHAFRYKCPLGDLQVAGKGIIARKEAPGADGWTTVRLDTHPGEPSVLTLQTAEVYQVPTDKRQFGCMIGDLEPVR